MRVVGKMCVRDKIFYDDKYHCARSERQKPRLQHRERRSEKEPDDRKHGFHRTACRSEQKGFSPALCCRFHGKSDRRAFGKILNGDTDRKRQSGNICGIFTHCRSRTEHRKKHFSGFFQRTARAFFLVRPIVEVRYDMIEQYQEQTAQQKTDKRGNKIPLAPAFCPFYGRNDERPHRRTDAATMTPDAKPRKSVFTFSDISLLKNQTIALPAVVARKMTENPKIIIAV